MQLLRRLFRFLRPFWKFESILFVVMMALAALTLALPIALKYMIDDLIPSLSNAPTVRNALLSVLYFGLVLVGIYLLNVLLSLARDYLAAYISGGIVRNLRSELFDTIQHASLRFHHKHQTGEMMSRILSDVARVQDLLTNTLLMFLTNLLLLAAILIYLLNVNWILTMVALVPVPLTVLFSNKFGRRLHDLTQKLQETIAGLTARLQESLLGVKTVKAFGREDNEKHKVDTNLGSLWDLYIRRSVTTSLAFNLVHFFNMIGPVAVLAWGTYLVAGGSMKLGSLMAFYILLTYLYQPVKDLASINVEVRSALASVSRVMEYLDVPPEIVHDPNPIRIKAVRGNVAFQKVSFCYEPEGFSLTDFNLELSPGEKVALVGPSGSGKTTVAALLMRFFDPESGHITLDEIDLRRHSIETLRSKIGLVEQDPLLFRGTIRENLAFGDPDATERQMHEATEVANIRSFIEQLPDGFDTVLGERGVNLSGGEKQRLCLARTILRNPPVIILDEATSSVDAESERLIQDALKRVLADKTALIIAHRFSTIRQADRIVVLEHGRIVEQGSHESLLKDSSLYSRLALNEGRAG